MQLSLIEFAINVLKIKNAGSTEINKKCVPVIGLIEEWYKDGILKKGDLKKIGGTMRLGKYECNLLEKTLIRQIYKSNKVFERHRHRYEVNIKYREKFEQKGLIFSGLSNNNKLPETIELKSHPWFIGVQFHPEFKSRPLNPHPLFASFIKAAKNNKKMTKIKEVKIGNFKISNTLPIVLIAGPCQLENREHALYIAESINKICKKLSINFIYKTSFDKANRSSHLSERGLGLEKSIKIFEEIKGKIKIPILTDVHTVEQCSILKDSVDVIQIPAFLCRQTDLLQSAAKTNLVINVKKGQFLAPWDVPNIVKKIENYNTNILLTEEEFLLDIIL